MDRLTSISIVVPAYNEEKRLPQGLRSILAYLQARQWDFREVIIVDDGSSDGTAAYVREQAATCPEVRLLQNPGNRGKGYTVRHGMLDAQGDWVLYTDADLSSPIEELDTLFQAAQTQNAVIAFGSRALAESKVEVHQPMLREYSGRFFNLVMRGLTGLPFHDTQCGFKLFRRDAAQAVFSRQQLDGFGFDVEALFIARQLGLKAVEVPVRWADVEGTKVSMLRGLDGFVDLARIRRNQFEGKYRKAPAQRSEALR